MPDKSLVVEFHGREDGIASVWAAELVFAPRRAVNRDKEPTAFGHPLWNCVRQLFADGQIHARSVAKHSHGAKRKDGTGNALAAVWIHKGRRARSDAPYRIKMSRADMTTETVPKSVVIFLP